MLFLFHDFHNAMFLYQISLIYRKQAHVLFSLGREK